MSVKNIETRFSYSNLRVLHVFTGIRELGFNERGSFVISAWTTEVAYHRGSYFTVIPISPVEYRRKYPSATSFRRECNNLTVLDDYGTEYAIYAPDHVLDVLVADCIANEIPEQTETP